jgi:Bacterial protein of unknown function (DUF937)
MNLVSLIMQFLAPAIINKLAGSLGLNQGLAGKAIAAAIPAILAGLAGSTSKSGGAASLAGMLGKQDPGLLGNFANMLGGSNQQSMIDQGSNALSSLLGGSSTGALAGAIGKFAGIDAGQSKSLLGALTPVVLGTLAKEQKAGGLDAGGLANLLAGQHDNIAAALPPGFANLLQGSGILDSVAGSMQKTASVTPKVAVGEPHPSSGGSMGLPSWLLPLLAGLAALWAITSYGCNQAPEIKSTAPAKVEKAAPAVEAPKAAAPAADAAKTAMPGAELTGQATSALDALKAALGGVKDEATAKSSLPKLQEIAAQIEKLKGVAGGLPADARHPLVIMVSGAMPGLAKAMETALALPGVGAVLKPVLDQIAANLGAVTKM